MNDTHPFKTEDVAPVVGHDISHSLYDQVVEIFQEQQNFLLSGYKNLCIRRRLAARIRAAGFRSAEAYVSCLADDSAEQELLLAALSVHVSHFFRNPSVFKALEHQILPDLAKRNSREKAKLRIWSVGCAHGEEPYSLALLCQRAELKPQRVSIIATDLSPEALRKARQGYYSEDRLIEVPMQMRQEFFFESGRSVQLCESIREQVQFFRHDILADQPFYRAELILCRNLLIYFSRQQQQQVLEKLAGALLPGGYLVLGRAETMATSCRHLFNCVDPAERIYQRVANEPL
jgi:chemotaxis protein methyltransferase CheR